MDVEEFKKKYEQLKDNPMYKNFCSILDTKSQVLERTAKENQELKKQLEEGILESLYFDMITDENIIFKNQQKEFIEWLENKIKERNNDIKLLGSDCYTSKYGYKEVLSKYKEIIGSETNER